jgi:GNAT superfamily N-acetyltransferase
VAAIEIQVVGQSNLDALARLFTVSRETRHCWCVAYCSTSWEFATGWYGGGNRRRFEALAASEPYPMGMLAVRDGEPIGWCACGPRLRYTAALAGRGRLLADRPREEDRDVWLIACLFVRPDRTGDGVLLPLIRGAIQLARDAGATAVEAWPLAMGIRRPGEAHLGREGVFARLGVRRVAQPSPDRVIMRLDASGRSS